MVLVLFTVRDRKLRKIGVGRSVETARADAAKQVLRYIKEGEKFFLGQSVIYFQRKQRGLTGACDSPDLSASDASKMPR